MGHSVLLVGERDGIATLTLNRPAAMNALSGALRAANEQVRQVTPEDVAARRAGIQARRRQQAR